MLILGHVTIAKIISNISAFKYYKMYHGYWLTNGKYLKPLMKYYDSIFPLPFAASSCPCSRDLDTCVCSFNSDALTSLELCVFDSMQLSGLAERSLDIGGGDGLQPSSFLTDNFNSGVFRGGRLSAVLTTSLTSLLFVVTERSSGCNRPSGDGGSSTLLASTLDGS